MSVPRAGNIALGMSLFPAPLQMGPACLALLLTCFGLLSGSLVSGGGGAGLL